MKKFLLVFSLLQSMQFLSALNVGELRPNWQKSIFEYPPRESEYISAKAYLVFDLDSGTVLDIKNGNSEIPPASLTKLVTISLFLDFIKSQSININSEVKIPEEAYAKNMPPRSSLMFLGPNQRVSYKDLLYGLAVDSGNDAAVAISLIVAGTEDGFVNKMNDLVKSLGLVKTHFVEPSGYDAHNITTAFEFASFVSWYTTNFPETETIHSTKFFTFPRNENLTTDIQGPITQKNRNELLWTYPGVTGLKTGFIDESGYNIAISAHKGKFRLGMVILGALSEADRARNASQLLDQVFSDYVSVGLKLDKPVSVKVFNGDTNKVSFKDLEFRTCLPKNLTKNMKVISEAPEAVQGAFTDQDALGFISWYSDETLVARMPLTKIIKSEASINGFFDSIYLGVLGIFGNHLPPKASEIHPKVP